MVQVIDPALQAHLGNRADIAPRVLIWFHAVNALTGLSAPWGVWNGDDDRVFTVDAESRLYYGAGALASVGDLVSEPGYAVRVHRCALSHFHPDVAAALATTRLRRVRCDWHQVHLAPGGHDLIAAPRLRFRGLVEVLREPTPAQGQTAVAELQLASAARQLTIPLPLVKSDALQRSLYPGDTFRQWNVTSGRVNVAWGEINDTGSAGGGGRTPSGGSFG